MGERAKADARRAGVKVVSSKELLAAFEKKRLEAEEALNNPKLQKDLNEEEEALPNLKQPQLPKDVNESSVSLEVKGKQLPLEGLNRDKKTPDAPVDQNPPAADATSAKSAVIATDEAEVRVEAATAEDEKTQTPAAAT